MSTCAERKQRLIAAERHLAELDARAAAAGVSDAATDRHLCWPRDRAYLSIALDAELAAINVVSLQAAAGFDQLEQVVARVGATVDAGTADRGIAEIRGRFDQLDAGIAQIIELLTRHANQQWPERA